MLSIVRAHGPDILENALLYKEASAAAQAATTELVKQASVVSKAARARDLVDSAVKLGSAVLKSLRANENTEKILKLKKKKKKKELEKESSLSSMSIPKALALGTGVAIPGAMAANYLMNKASDDLDAKMYAIPGIAAATVAAVLAAKGGLGNFSSDNTKELAKALEAKDVIDRAITNSPEDTGKVAGLLKMSSLNTEHVAILITELLDA